VTFACHYLEMVLAMVLGMMALGPPLNSGLELLGARPDTWRHAAPELSLIAMGVTMTVPMAAWMFVRGHRWQAGLEMCLAMLVPTVGAVGALAAGVTDNLSAVFAAEHTAMFVGMFGVMWWRREEYSCDGHGGRRRRRLDGRDVTAGH
jgi:hypothetical protein